MHSSQAMSADGVGEQAQDCARVPAAAVAQRRRPNSVVDDQRLMRIRFFARADQINLLATVQDQPSNDSDDQ